MFYWKYFVAVYYWIGKVTNVEIENDAIDK